MSLKPPKYLYLKAKEAKVQIQGFKSIELQERTMCRVTDGSVAAWEAPAEAWRHSWKQVTALRLIH